MLLARATAYFSSQQHVKIWTLILSLFCRLQGALLGGLSGAFGALLWSSGALFRRSESLLWLLGGSFGLTWAVVHVLSIMDVVLTSFLILFLYILGS